MTERRVTQVQVKSDSQIEVEVRVTGEQAKADTQVGDILRQVTSEHVKSDAVPVASRRVSAEYAYVDSKPVAASRVTLVGVMVDVRIITQETPQVPSLSITPPELFTQEGLRLAHLSGFNIRRSFMLNDIGTGELVLPRGSAPLTTLSVDVDRLVLVRSKYGLPDWLGVIVEIDFDFEKATCRLQEATCLLKRWNGFGLPIGFYVGGLPQEATETGTVPSLIANLIQRANARQETLLRIGQIDFPEPEQITITHGKDRSIYDTIKELQDAVSFDFWTEPYFDSQRRLRIKLNLAREKRRDRRQQVTLWEGKSISDDSTYKVLSKHYGYDRTELLGITITDTSLWKYLELGDVISVRSSSLGHVGISKDVRILGMEPNEEAGTLVLATEIV